MPDRNRIVRWLAGALAATAACTAIAAQPLSMSAICDDCKPVKFANCGKGTLLEGPSFDKEGSLWLVALFSGTIHKVTPDGQCTSVASIGGGPNGARLDGTGNLIITDRDRNLLAYNIQSKQTTVRRSKHGRETMRGLNDLVIDKRGGIYFTEPYGSHALKPTGRVFYLPPGSSDADGAAPMTVVGEGFAFPNGIALSPDETRLYVGDYATNRIFSLQLAAPGVLHPMGVPYVFATLTGGFGPDGMTVDSQGNLYVAHYRAGEVVVFNYNGFPYGSIRLPDEAGLGTTNVVLRDGWLYIIDGTKDDIWRVKTKVPGL